MYRVIEQIFSIFRTFIFMYFNFSYPTICYEIEKNIKNGLNIWKYYHLAHLVIIIIGVILIYALNEYVLDFFHISAQDKGNLIHLLTIALLVPILLVVSQALRQLMFALNLTNYYTKIIYFSCSLSVMLLSLMVFYIGLIGSFISMIIVEITVIILYTTIIKKNLTNKDT